MIRKFKKEDRLQVEEILKEGLAAIEEDDHEFFFQKEHITLVSELEKIGIIGIASLACWGDRKEKSTMFLYIAPKYRRQGYGTALYQAMRKETEILSIEQIENVFRVDLDDPTCFFQKRGYEKWYGIHYMKYQGKEQLMPEAEIVPYEDRFFEDYIDGMRKGFYEMRKVHDFQPHLCVEFSEEQRRKLIEAQKNLFVLLVNGKFAASAAVRSERFDMLGPIFVAPAYQGRGYGRLITQYVINEAIKRGIKDITLSVVEWNQRAVNMYESLGFQTIQTTHSYRHFLKR